MNTKSILLFLGGSAVGGAAGVLGTMSYFKKKYGAIADMEIEEMEKYYTKKNRELVELFEEDEFQEESDLKDEKKSEIKEKLTRNYEQTTNYANMYKKNKDYEHGTNYDDIYKKNKVERTELMEKDAEREFPTEDEEDENSMEYQARMATEDHKANMNRPPKIISEESLGEIPGYIEHKVLFFYRIDDILTDEEDQIIDDPDYLLGDALDKFNFRESDETTIFVRNFALDTVYEVQKIEGEFEEE